MHPLHLPGHRWRQQGSWLLLDPLLLLLLLLLDLLWLLQLCQERLWPGCQCHPGCLVLLTCPVSASGRQQPAWTPWLAV
jgi:hypothetical protein